MKKLFFAIIALCSTLGANAQVDTDAPQVAKSIDFQYGFKAGLVFTTYDSDADDFQARFGNWGFICRWKAENWAIQPELHYTTQGVRSLIYKIRICAQEYDNYGKYNDRDDARSNRFRLNLKTYNIQMPIIVKWYMPIESFKGVNIQVGPKIGAVCDYEVSCPTTNNGLLLSPELGARGNIRNFGRDVNRFTVAADFGAGFDSKSGIGFDLRCSMGLRPVFKNEKQKAFTHAHDRVWSVAFTYVF